MPLLNAANGNYEEDVIKQNKYRETLESTINIETEYILDNDNIENLTSFLNNHLDYENKTLGLIEADLVNSETCTKNVTADNKYSSPMSLQTAGNSDEEDTYITKDNKTNGNDEQRLCFFSEELQSEIDKIKNIVKKENVDITSDFNGEKVKNNEFIKQIDTNMHDKAKSVPVVVLTRLEHMTNLNYKLCFTEISKTNINKRNKSEDDTVINSRDMNTEVTLSVNNQIVKLNGTANNQRKELFSDMNVIFRTNSHNITLLSDNGKRRHISKAKRKAYQSTRRRTTVHLCEYCNARHASKKLLTQHLQSHKKSTNINSESSKSSKCKPIDREKTVYMCDYCGAAIDTKSNLIKHMQCHGEVRSSYGSTERQQKCTHCNYTTTRDQQLKNHMQMHNKEMPFNCMKCNYKTKTNFALQVHLRKHTGEKPYICDMCPFRSTQFSTLTNHKRVHTLEKPYKCSDCPFETAHSGTLNRHMRIHTGLKVYKCSLCSYESCHSSSLKTHQKVHNEQTSKPKTEKQISKEDRPYKCHICSFDTIHNRYLKRHLRKHTGEFLKCHICSYETIQSCDLKRHLMRHTGEKPFKCHLCGHQAIHNSNLKTHLKLQHGL